MAILERINLFTQKGRDMTLAKLLKEGVVCFLEEDTQKNALNKLVDALVDAGEVSNKEVFFEAILKRETIVSTGIGMGVAVPHAKLADFDHFFLAVGLQKSKEGIEWDALDQTPVRLIFLIGGPANQQTEYLKILSRLTAAVKDEERRKRLLCAESKEDILALFEGID